MRKLNGQLRHRTTEQPFDVSQPLETIGPGPFQSQFELEQNALRIN
jgi:hypothetical protein